MRMPLVCRLLIDAPLTGAWNMAVDEVLLDLAASRGDIWLRFYQWADPTLSLGYFQRVAERHQHAASRKCPLVRRSSGGGAIVHDRELTYAVALPVDAMPTSDPCSLYDAVHDGLVAVLADWQILAERAAGVTPGASGAPFLCFQRCAPGDVVVAGYKVAGSAQRRRRQAVLQHGSLLLARSPAAPELPGLLELAGRDLDPLQTANAWGQQIARRIGASLETGQFAAAERELVKGECFGRFDSGAWTNRR